MMSDSIRYTAMAAILAVGVPGTTMAAFIGNFDVSRWALIDSASGSVGVGSAPDVITLTGGDSVIGGTTDFTNTALDSGTLSFDWAYVTNDVYQDPLFDPFGYLLNGAFTVLAGISTPESPSQVGSVSLQINAGDVFGFRAETLDGYYGPSVTNISHFEFAVPEPSIWALFGVGLVGVAARQRRQRAPRPWE
jgi:hypothetical protein